MIVFWNTDMIIIIRIFLLMTTTSIVRFYLYKYVILKISKCFAEYEILVIKKLKIDCREDIHHRGFC
jgi:hypothetical protein